MTLMRGAAADAAEQADSAWQAHPAGAALIDPALQSPSPDLPSGRAAGPGLAARRARPGAAARPATSGPWPRSARTRSTRSGLTVMVAVFAATAFIPTGAEVAVAAGTTVAAQKVLEAIFGDQAVRRWRSGPGPTC